MITEVGLNRRRFIPQFSEDFCDVKTFGNEAEKMYLTALKKLAKHAEQKNISGLVNDSPDESVIFYYCLAMVARSEIDAIRLEEIDTKISGDSAPFGFSLKRVASNESLPSTIEEQICVVEDNYEKYFDA